MQHPALPVASVVQALVPSAKWNWQKEKQDNQCDHQRDRGHPITAINKIKNCEQRKCFDRDRECKQDAGYDFVALTQAEKGAEHEREQNQARLAEMITRPDKRDNDEGGDDYGRVLGALLR